jgi:hypothetical protein
MLLQNSWFNYRREVQIGLRYETTETRSSKTRRDAEENTVAAALVGRCLRI